MIDGAATLARRLERYRAALPQVTPPAAIDARGDGRVAADLAARLAAAVDGEVVTHRRGLHRPVRAADRRPAGRSRAARDAARPAAAGRAAGLPRHRDDRPRDRGRHRGLPDRARLVGGRPVPAGPAAAPRPRRGAGAARRRSRRAIPPDAWLVTYNGRGFDWPLLATRYRMARRAAPAHAGHLDLLPIVRRLFRHRMADARLRTAEAELLGIAPASATSRAGRSRAATSSSCAAARPSRSSRSSATTTRTSGRWAGCSPTSSAGCGDPAARAVAPPGDLAGLARAFARERGCAEALDCLDAAADRPTRCGRRIGRRRRPPRSSRRVSPPGETPRTRPGGRRGDRPTSAAAAARPAVTVRVRQRAGRGALDDGADRRRPRPPPAPPRAVRRRRPRPGRRWPPGPGRTAVVAAIELAKIREHRLRDPVGGARGRRPGARRDRAPPPARDDPSPRSRPTCCGASSGSDRGACQPLGPAAGR